MSAEVKKLLDTGLAERALEVNAGLLELALDQLDAGLSQRAREPKEVKEGEELAKLRAMWGPLISSVVVDEDIAENAFNFSASFMERFMTRAAEEADKTIYEDLKTLDPRSRLIYLMRHPSFQACISKLNIRRVVFEGDYYCTGKVIQLLKENPQITSLEIVDCDITSGKKTGSLMDISRELANNTLQLKSLQIGNCVLFNAEVLDLVCSLKTNKHLQILDLEFINATPGAPILGDIAVKLGQAFAEALTVNQTLQTLSVEGCELGNEVCLPILQALGHNQTLRVLNLAKNRLNSEFVKILTDLQVSQAFHGLDLSRNQLLPKSGSVDPLFLALENFLRRNPGIEDLEITGKDLDPFAYQQLRPLLVIHRIKNMIQRIRTNRYEQSELDCSLFGFNFTEAALLELDKVLLELLENLKFNTQIKKINFGPVLRNPEHIKLLTQVLQQNQTLKNLAVSIPKQTLVTDEMVLAAITRKVPLEEFRLNCGEPAAAPDKMLPQLNKYFESTEKLGIRELRIGNYYLGSEAGYCIARTLIDQKSRLEHLVLTHCGIGAYGGSAIMQTLNRNDKLRELTMADVGFDGKTTCELASILSLNTTLHTVSYEGVIDEEASKAWIAMLRINTKIKSILCCNILHSSVDELFTVQDRRNIKMARRAKYQQAVKDNKSEIVLDEYCDDDNEWVLKICEDLRKNRSIEVIDFSSKNLNTAVFQVLCESLKHNQSVQSIKYHGGYDKNSVKPKRIEYVLSEEEEKLILEMLAVNTTLCFFEGFNKGGILLPSSHPKDQDLILQALNKNERKMKAERSVLLYMAFKVGFRDEKVKPSDPKELFEKGPYNMIRSFAGLLEGVQEQEPDDPNFPSDPPLLVKMGKNA